MRQRLTQAEQRARRLTEQATRLAADRAQLAADIIPEAQIAAAEAAVAEAIAQQKTFGISLCGVGGPANAPFNIVFSRCSVSGDGLSDD